MAPKRKRKARSPAPTDSAASSTTNESSSSAQSSQSEPQPQPSSRLQRRKTVSPTDELLIRLRTLHPLCNYSANPAVHFRQRSREVLQSKKRADLLPVIFAHPLKRGVHHLPNEIIQLCMAYCLETVEAIIEQTIDLCGKFINAGGFRRVLESHAEVHREMCRLESQTELEKLLCAFRGEQDARRIEDFRNTVDHRSHVFFWWFRLRKRVPAFVSLREVDTAGSNERYVCFTTFRSHEIVNMAWEEVETEGVVSGKPVFRFPCLYGRNWHALLGSIQDLDLIGPCLNSSTVTLEQVDACTHALYARHGRSGFKDTIFNVLIGLATIQLWTGDLENFRQVSIPSAAQKTCQLVWNEFYEKYHFGEPFAISS